MADFNKYVPFLEASDFEGGKLKINKIETQFRKQVDSSRVRPKNYAVICLVKAQWCGHCVHFMPDYAKFASMMEDNLDKDEKVVRCVAIEQTDKEAFEAFSGQIKEIRAFPTIVAFNSNGECISKEHKGQRTFDALHNYAHQCIYEGYKEPIKPKK